MKLETFLKKMQDLQELARAEGLVAEFWTMGALVITPPPQGEEAERQLALPPPAPSPAVP